MVIRDRSLWLGWISHHFRQSVPVLHKFHPYDCLSASGVSHYCDVIMGGVASQITSLTIVYSTVYSDADQRRHQSSTSLAFVRGIHRGPVNSPHKWPVTWKLFPFDDVIMCCDQILLAVPWPVINCPTVSHRTFDNPSVSDDNPMNGYRTTQTSGRRPTALTK